MKYEAVAIQFIEAIKTIADKPENLASLENYLSYHFPEWLQKRANTPETLVCDMREFANMII